MLGYGRTNKGEIADRGVHGDETISHRCYGPWGRRKLLRPFDLEEESVVDLGQQALHRVGAGNHEVKIDDATRNVGEIEVENGYREKREEVV